MRWQGRRQSENVQDVRYEGGRPGGGLGGGLGDAFRIPGGMGPGGQMRIPIGRGQSGGFGCGTLIVIGVVLYLLGINPLTILTQGGLGDLGPSLAPDQQPQIDRTSKQPRSDDEMTQFVKTILGSTEDVWTQVFRAYGKEYPKPTTILFSGSVQSACGMASAATGPFYCPGDKKVYIDLDFYRQLSQQFGASGDFAQAYVLAHEIGHHVQNLIGVLPEFNKMRQSMGKLEVNKMSVKVELQADCFAGVWGSYVAKEGWLEQGDLEEAINAANKIGDDSIQKSTQGYVVPDSFTHGTSEQRRKWFRRGFEGGRIEQCDTFNAKDL